MRVLFLTHAFPRYAGDAAGSFLLRLAVALRPEGIDVHVIAPAAPGFPARDTIEGIPVHRFRYAPQRYQTLAYTGTMAEQVGASWSARFSLLGFLGAELRAAQRARRTLEPAVVHAHWWFPSGVVATWMRALSPGVRMPMVTTLHGSDVRLGRRSALSRSRFRAVLERSAAVTTVSNWLASGVTDVLPTARPIVAPMPAATDLFHPGSARSADRLLFVGRANEQKGLQVLIRALARTSAPLSLDVIGDGEGRAPLERLASELGVAERVHWHGALPHTALAPYYRCAAALVVPSIDEGLGLVAVEGQLCGAPVIASNSGGLPDIVQDGRTGLLVPPGDPEALARTIDTLLARPDRGAALGHAGRLHALDLFSPNAVARRYAEIYRSAIVGAGAPSAT
ncbi:MAG TPA: glycosyltransferase [Gemmatimonadaceae bacterium]|nr:glycosyltransferase [Gemmatimonadaceae bacterium]